jgi:uncharacterized protein YcbK (DUF882 family)
MGAAALLASFFAWGQASAEERYLKLYNLHTQERATIVFKRDGVYDRGGLQALNQFLRDWRKDRPTNMDPHLFDLLWQVYKTSGSRDYINVVCGFRSPETNGMLRRRSSGVAKNSLHMQGKAMDFFLPDVPLAKLREVGLRMQLGGVGFYPTSGSPFVHMDTGSVRHWPRMTHDQLVRVFPNGNTLHVPSDGKPLPGYQEALAAYKARKADLTADTRVASFGGSPFLSKGQGPASGKPVMVAANVGDDGDDDEGDDSQVATADPTPLTPAARGRPVGVAVASYATTPVPMPRVAPRMAAASFVPPQTIAAPVTVATLDMPTGAPSSMDALVDEQLAKAEIDFGAEQNWSAPAVPAALAAAMAERDTTRRGSSLPIAPTAVVATIDVSRPLRAEAITTAVLRRSENDTTADVPRLMAYAPAAGPAQAPVVLASAGGVPLPHLNPLHVVARQPLRQPPPRPVAMPAPELTMTALDTQGLRMLIGPASTRQKTYALLTMPDFAADKQLMDKPDIAFAAGFGRYPYPDLRTDHFSGVLVQQPAVVDLRYDAFTSATQ